VVQVNVLEAKTHLSRLLAQVARGDEVVIAKDGRPVARLTPIRDEPEEGRVFGAAQGRYGSPPDDTFAPLDDAELAEWEAP
jgi:prevent-host-death family protein